MDSTTTRTPGRGRLRVPEKPTPAEKAQARDVSLRRIGALFVPHRAPSRRHRDHRRLVRVGMASPFLLRAVIDTALAEPRPPPARRAHGRHGRRRRR